MLIGLCGPSYAGKKTIVQYLVNELGFSLVTAREFFERHVETKASTGHATPSVELLTQCWRSNINVVIGEIAATDSRLKDLLVRPYFLLIHVEAPLIIRFQRYEALAGATVVTDEDKADKTDKAEALERFMRAEDEPRGESSSADSQTDVKQEARMQIYNDYTTKDKLHEKLRDLDLTDVRRLRPTWDAYFMALANLASERTNCMKRRVGCVIARDRRMVASGYNGTPSGVKNCNAGGCDRCNGTARQGVGLDLCLCLHAEENAIIEAGRDRCTNATLYTSLFPCILCAKKIVQAGIARIVFDAPYATDEASEKLMKAGSVIIDRFERVNNG